MNEDLVSTIKNLTIDLFKNADCFGETLSTIADKLCSHMERNDGMNWNCIMEAHIFNANPIKGYFIYYKIDQLGIVLFANQVEDEEYDKDEEEKKSKLVATFSDELNKKDKEIESLLKLKIAYQREFGRIKAEVEELTANLEKERKTRIELNMQNIGLNSLLKKGHESFVMEQERAKQLEEKNCAIM